MGEKMQQLAQNLENIPVTNDMGDSVKHVLDKKMIGAVNAALAINRPLLIWGEPGIGKSQLARAVAHELQRPFVSFTADSRTEAHDLQYHFDAVARLAEAQLRCTPGGDPENKDSHMAMERFIIPGPLWWAFNWDSAEEICTKYNHAIPDTVSCDPKNGLVVLIDEIDKAGSDVPNGLLESLGASCFHPRGMDKPVLCDGPKPLVMITTNEERFLPDAFVRRCLSLHLFFPKETEGQINFLVARAQQNSDCFSRLSAPVFQKAAEMLVEDRQRAKDENLFPLPGQAEYFDLLRGVQHQSESAKTEPMDLIDSLREYVYRKHPGFHKKSS